MYKYTRQEAANFLKISTRSIDRYVKSWKLRAKKEWKIIYINAPDLENLKWWGKKQEIIEKKSSFKITPLKKTENEVVTKNTLILDEIYFDLKNEIREKDKVITELSIRLWQAEEIAKNSVSLIDYKKSQFLLEESRTNLNQAIIDLESDKEWLEKELKYQKVNNIIMLVALVVLFAIAGTLFLLKI
jgi:hypothetical protein